MAAGVMGGWSGWFSQSLRDCFIMSSLASLTSETDIKEQSESESESESEELDDELDEKLDVDGERLRRLRRLEEVFRYRPGGR